VHEKKERRRVWSEKTMGGEVKVDIFHGARGGGKKGAEERRGRDRNKRLNPGEEFGRRVTEKNE